MCFEEEYSSLSLPLLCSDSVRCLCLSGTIHAIFEKSNNHYTWKKVTTTVHNIIVGKLWIDQVRYESDVVSEVADSHCPVGLAFPSFFHTENVFSRFFSVCHQSGEIDVVNHTTGDRCHLKFAPYSYFSRDVARKVRNPMFF